MADADQLQRLLAVVRDLDVEALQPEVDLNEPGDVLVVVDHEDEVFVARFGHGVSPSGGRGAAVSTVLLIARTAAAGSAAP